MGERKSTRVAVVSTKGGVGKTTVTANLGGLLADLGKRVLLVDADLQPTLSSYYSLANEARLGLFEWLVSGATEVVSRSEIENLDIVASNDPAAQLPNLLLHAPDGRTRLRFLLDQIDSEYDVTLIDTQGSVSALQDAAVLAADRLLSPVPPEMLSAREFGRGTLAMLDRLRTMERLGLPIAPLSAFLNRVDRTRDAHQIADALRHELKDRDGIQLLNTVIPNLVVYREAGRYGAPVHRYQRSRPVALASGAAGDTMHSLAAELFPDWCHGEKSLAGTDRV